MSREASIGPFPAEPAPGSPEAIAQAAETIDPQRNAEIIRAYKDAPLTITREEYDALVQGHDDYAQQSRELANALELAISAIDNLDFAAWERSGRASNVYREMTGVPSLAEAAAVMRDALRKAGRA